MIDHVDNLYPGLDGNADGTLSIVGNISGQIPVGEVTLFQAYLPGLSFPSYVAEGSRHHTIDSSSRLIVESLKSVLNLRY